MATGGFTTINSTHITGGTGFTGVSSQSTSPDPGGRRRRHRNRGREDGHRFDHRIEHHGRCGHRGRLRHRVHRNGPANLPSTLAHLTISDHTTVKGYTDGLVINNGHVDLDGQPTLRSRPMAATASKILSDLNIAGTNPMDPLSRVSITGASITGNGRGGVLVRDVAPVTLDGVKVTMNGTTLTGNGPFATAGNVAFGGIDVQRSADAGSQRRSSSRCRTATVSQNAGCGITVSGGGDDLVNRTMATDGNRVCGFGGTGPPQRASRRIRRSRRQRSCWAGTTAAAAFGEIFGGATNIGGKVSATLRRTRVQNNTGVGIYITEARDPDPAITRRMMSPRRRFRGTRSPAT